MIAKIMLNLIIQSISSDSKREDILAQMKMIGDAYPLTTGPKPNYTSFYSVHFPMTKSICHR